MRSALAFVVGLVTMACVSFALFSNPVGLADDTAPQSSPQSSPRSGPQSGPQSGLQTGPQTGPQPSPQSGDSRPRTAETPPAGAGAIVERKQFDQAFMGKLIETLARTEGCLGVELGQFQSGKGVIFAWFKDKASAMRFYKTDIHQDAIQMSGYDAGPDHIPMSDVPADSGPIMIVASARPVQGTNVDSAPALELGIEIYAPLPGGVRFGGGSFSPAAFQEAARAKSEHK